MDLSTSTLDIFILICLIYKHYRDIKLVGDLDFAGFGPCPADL